MICPKCGHPMLFNTSLLTLKKFEEYKGEIYYYCYPCDVKIPREGEE